MTLKQSEREIRRLRPGDELDVLNAAALFDREPTLDFAIRFLSSVGHHLLIAYEGGTAAGFVSGVEMTHPDKGTEMFLYELGVAEPFRRRGIGTALVVSLGEIARERGCYGMWVITDRADVAACATYRRAGAMTESESNMLSWAFGRSAP